VATTVTTVPGAVCSPSEAEWVLENAALHVRPRQRLCFAHAGDGRIAAIYFFFDKLRRVLVRAGLLTAPGGPNALGVERSRTGLSPEHHD
jgi:hypothetical protein